MVFSKVGEDYMLNLVFISSSHPDIVCVGHGHIARVRTGHNPPFFFSHFWDLLRSLSWGQRGKGLYGKKLCILEDL